jgi:anti-anti-sigma factor
MGEELKIAIRRQNGLAVVQFIGDVTTFAEDLVQNAYQEASQSGLQNIALDFTTCEYINSAGIAVIIGVVTEARRKGQQVYAFGLSSHYQKLFRMVGLTDYISICESEAETLKRISPGASG